MKVDVLQTQNQVGRVSVLKLPAKHGIAHRPELLERTALNIRKPCFDQSHEGPAHGLRTPAGGLSRKGSLVNVNGETVAEKSKKPLSTDGIPIVSNCLKRQSWHPALQWRQHWVVGCEQHEVRLTEVDENLVEGNSHLSWRTMRHGNKEKQ